MARYLLLPGFGGRYEQTVALVSTVQNYSDELDTSRASQFAVQVKTWAAGALSVQIQQSFDGTNFSNLGNAQSLVAGDTIQVGPNSGPFGIIRVGLISSDTSANVTIDIVGMPTQWSN